MAGPRHGDETKGWPWATDFTAFTISAHVHFVDITYRARLSGRFNDVQVGLARTNDHGRR